MNNLRGYPTFDVGYVNNLFEGTLLFDPRGVKYKEVFIKFPTRLNTVVLDQTKIAPNKEMLYPAGEILLSIGLFVSVRVKFLGNYEGNINVHMDSERDVLVLHAYYLMCAALNRTPSFEIFVDDSSIPRHSGFGSSGAILGGVCAAINEIFGCPLKAYDIVRYLMGNYGEEISVENLDKLQCMPCFGGSFTTGFFEGAIQVIAGHAVPIMKINLERTVVIGVAKEYQPLTAYEEVDRHAKYLFSKTDNNYDQMPVSSIRYNEIFAYNILNKILPRLAIGDLTGLKEAAFHQSICGNDHSAADLSWLFPKAAKIAHNITGLYYENRCQVLGMSSTGPAFYAVVDNMQDQQECMKRFADEGMDVCLVPLYGDTYRVEY